jgi:hypothetical protein
MIRHRFSLQFNSLMFDADRGSQRVAIGVLAALALMGPSISAFPFATLWIAMALLLPRRAT